MIGIIGNGSWATALAKMVTDNGHKITWWMRNEEAVQHLLNNGHNELYLSSVTFDSSLIAPTNDIQKLFADCEIVLICIPSAYVLDVIKNLPKSIFENKKIISAIKGILPTHQLLQEYLMQQYNVKAENYFAISGPCHAEEVAQERLSYLTFSGTDENAAQQIARYFETKYLRTTTNNDLWGTQYAAVLKNIYAVGAGIAHGLGYGDNFLSVYITNCYREMFRFLEYHYEEKNNQDPKPDFHTSAYLGDLLVTCYSPHSRNRTFGALLGKGYSVKSAMAEMNMVAEGYYASAGMNTIISNLATQMPIKQMIFEILWENKKAATVFKSMEKILF